jgi:hypothetical protein
MGHVAHMGLDMHSKFEPRNVNGKDHLGDLDLDGGMTDIKIDSKECGVD